MRADRLLSLMLLLQSRKQMTAEELADELEVSKRTIYRDIDALSIAGVPVYSNGGPGGGYALLDSYRTTLTGLKEDEIRALFALTIPSPITDLDVSQSLKNAILKVTSTGTGNYEEHANYLRQRLHLDAASWFQPAEMVPHLKVVQEAAWEDRQLILSYRRSNGKVSERTISPYALVSKASIWYLVTETDKGMRVYRVSRIQAVQISQTRFARRKDFDLATFWASWVADYETSLPKYLVTLRIGPDLIAKLPNSIRSIAERSQPDAEGWHTLDYTFERIEEAQAYVLGMGASVDVIAPEELQTSVLKLASDVITRHSQRAI